MPEDIPDEDDVSRHLYAPSMGAPTGDLIWENVFMFRTVNNFCESVVWRKYAPAIDDVHALGCQKQRNDRAAGRQTTYFGALTANVGRLRALRSINGARFTVVHTDAEGIHHAHICYDPASPLSKNDKAELRKYIKDEFNQRSDHVCPEEH